MIPQTDGTFFGSIAGISAKMARSFNRKRGFDGVHVGLQVSVHRGARVGFGLGGVLNRGQAVAHVLRQLVAVHAAARQLAHRRVTHLLLHVFDRVLNGLRRHARTRGVTQFSRRRELAQRVAQPVQRLPQLLRRGVEVRFQLRRLHVRLVGQVRQPLRERALPI